jgi:anti-sigma regulatory factor (Ser/Thr protein kinase)
MNPNILQLTFRNSAEEAPRMARRVEHFLHEKTINESLINKTLLCVDELITNIIAHAYADEDEHAVLLQCTIAPTFLVLELRDDGVAFNPTTQSRAVVEGGIDERSVGGLGIHLVMSLMDKVEYEREGDYNVLKATKFFE